MYIVEFFDENMTTTRRFEAVDEQEVRLTLARHTLKETKAIAILKVVYTDSNGKKWHEVDKMILL